MRFFRRAVYAKIGRKERNWKESHVSVMRVQSRGQATLPQDIREACGITPGAEVLCIPTGPSSFECQVLPPRLSVDELLAKYGVDDSSPSSEQLEEELAHDIAAAVLAECGQSPVDAER